jgi:hypothetical protein
MINSAEISLEKRQEVVNRIAKEIHDRLKGNYNDQQSI